MAVRISYLDGLCESLNDVVAERGCGWHGLNPGSDCSLLFLSPLASLLEICVCVCVKGLVTGRIFIQGSRKKGNIRGALRV